jgi:RNA polymerase sigma-70 factor (ECF subfamily)
VNDKTENNMTDRPLVEKVLRGNTEVFKIIIKNTEGLVAQIIFKMILYVEDRKDIAQDIYLKSFQNLKYFKFQSKLSTWIGQIAYNTCLNYLEKKKLVLIDNTNNEDETKESPLEMLDNKTIDITRNETENLIFRKEISEILKIEIDKLVPLYKTLITLYHNEELSYAEIAQITDLPEGTVKNYLFRARNKLRDNLLLTYKKEEL